MIMENARQDFALYSSFHIVKHGSYAFGYLDKQNRTLRNINVDI